MSSSYSRRSDDDEISRKRHKAGNHSSSSYSRSKGHRSSRYDEDSNRRRSDDKSRRHGDDRSRRHDGERSSRYDEDRSGKYDEDRSSRRSDERRAKRSEEKIDKVADESPNSTKEEKAVAPPKDEKTAPAVVAEAAVQGVTYEPPKGTLPLRTFKDHRNVVHTIKWHPNRDLVMTSGLDKTVRIFDVFKHQRCLQMLTYHSEGVKDARWSLDGKYILSAGFDKAAKVFDFELSRLLYSFPHTDFTTCIAPHHTEKFVFIVGTFNSGLFAWDMRVNQQILQFKTNCGTIQDVCFLPGTEQFVSASEVAPKNYKDKGLAIWDFRNPKVVSDYKEPHSCTSLQVHPTEPYFVAQFTAGYTALVNARHPYKVSRSRRYEGHKVGSFGTMRIGVDISSDGRLTCTGDAEGRLAVYDFYTTKILQMYPCTASACTDAAFHPTLPSTIATCSWDGTVHVWQ